MASSGRRLGVLAALALALLTLPPAVVAAPVPNYSLLVYKPGKLVIGTLTNGQYAHTRTVATSTAWTAAAISRDTLVLYNKKTGKAKVARLYGGELDTFGSRQLPTGYSTAVASCDTVLFYSKKTGKALIGEMHDGAIGATVKLTLAAGIDQLVASCDTLYALDDMNVVTTWTMAYGAISGYQSAATRDSAALAAASADSLMLIDCKCGGAGWWGTLENNAVTKSGSASQFSPWTLLGATADSVLFYNANGTSVAGTLSGGNYTCTCVDIHVPTGATLVAGGR